MDSLNFESKIVSNNKLWLKATGKLNSETLEHLKTWAIATEKQIAEMHASSGAPIYCVFDIRGIEEAKDPATITTLADFQSHNKPHIQRTALVVTNPEMKLTVSIVGAMAARDNIQIFETEEEARAWAFGN